MTVSTLVVSAAHGFGSGSFKISVTLDGRRLGTLTKSSPWIRTTCTPGWHTLVYTMAPPMKEKVTGHVNVGATRVTLASVMADPQHAQSLWGNGFEGPLMLECSASYDDATDAIAELGPGAASIREPRITWWYRYGLSAALIAWLLFMQAWVLAAVTMAAFLFMEFGPFGKPATPPRRLLDIPEA